MIEILAPVGGMQSVSAAINGGADAVYLGLKDFSARKNADNFSAEQLYETCRLSHSSGVKVYLTLNTLIYRNEFEQLREVVIIAARAGVDAVIVQDMAVVNAVKQICPEMPVHASTQMTIMSPYGIVMANKLGLKRVVLARELTCEQIGEITAKAVQCGIETEVFVHGALCVCLSGQCYMSSVFGGRSGNRGLCAQPCRLDFTNGGKNHILSLKDNCLISEMKTLESMGVTSAKIEGRMKRPEYVYAAAIACVSARSGEIPDMELLQSLFSRSGFTNGYYKNDLSNMNGIRRKEDVTAAKNALAEINKVINKPFKRYTFDLDAKISKNTFDLTIKPNIKFKKKPEIYTPKVFSKFDKPLQTAVNKPTTAEMVIKSLAKTGGTIFSAEKITCETEQNIIVPVSVINEHRRLAVGQMEQIILDDNTPDYIISDTADINSQVKRVEFSRVPVKYRIKVNRVNQLMSALECEYEYIYADTDIVSALDITAEQKERIILDLPVYLAFCEDLILKKLKDFGKKGYTKALAHTIAHIGLIKTAGMSPFGGFRLNVTNAVAAREYERLGVKDITASVEVKVAAVPEIKSEKPVGVIAYGRIPLMIARRCPINGDICGGSGKNCRITDRLNKKMILKCDKTGKTVEILNPEILDLTGKLKKQRGIDFAVIIADDNDNVKDLYQLTR